MYITKVDSNCQHKQNLYFKAKLSEQEIKLGLEAIINNGNSFVQKNIDYFIDMKKGSNIDPKRKTSINEWLRMNLAKALAFNAQKEEQQAIKQIEYLEKQEIPSKIGRTLKKVLTNVVNTLNGETEPEHPIMRSFLERKNEATFLGNFRDLFNSYIELSPRTTQTATTHAADGPLGLEDLLKQIGLEKYGLDMDSKPQESSLQILTPTVKPSEGTNLHIKSEVIKEPQKMAMTSSNEDILLRFESYEQRRLNSKPRTEMSVAEREADMEWYREEYYPLLEKIKEQNISTVPKKTFSENSREQVKEKREYIEYVLCRMNDNNASYYDGLLAFEKYGQREPFQDDYYSTLSLIKMNFPENADEKTVNKFMDIYEKFGKGLYLDEKGFLEDGCIDGNNYLTVIGEKGVIKSEEQLQRALEKGKKLIWSNDLIGDLEYNLLKAEDAPFKGNERVEKIIQEFYQTAYNNRTPFKDYPDIKTKEEQFWGISRN